MRVIAVVLSLASAVVARGQNAELPPKSCVVELRLARIAGARDDAAAELASLQRARAQCPDELGPIVALLIHGERQALPDEERSALRAAVANRLAGPLPVSTAALDQIARNPDLSGEAEREILTYLLQRLRDRPEVEPMRARVSLELRLGDLPAAAATLERLRAADDSEDVIWALIGVYRRLERWSELAKLLSGATASGAGLVDLPVRVEALSRAGQVTETMAAIDGLHATMANASRAAIDLFVDLVLRAAWNLRDVGADADAQKLFRLVLTHDPAQAEATGALVHLYGTEEDRRRHEDVAVDRWSGETNPYRLLEAGTDRLAAGDNAGAYSLLLRAAGQLQNTEAAWNNLGMAAIRLERWADAVDALKRSTEINPARADSFFFLGHAWVKQENWQEAIPPLLRSIELGGTQTLAHYDLYLCYQATQQSELADRHRRLYEEASVTKP